MRAGGGGLLLVAAALATACHATLRPDEAGPAAKVIAAAADSESACAGQDPAEPVSRFYGLYLHHDSGLPTAAAMAVIAPFLSQRLVAAIEHARGVQQAAIRAAPDDKPPFIEGSLFSSMFEGMTAVRSAMLKAGAAPTTVTVALRYDDRRTEPFDWSDDVLLRCEDGRWRIDDVEYRGGWDFAPAGRLREGLETAE